MTTTKDDNALNFDKCKHNIKTRECETCSALQEVSVSLNNMIKSIEPKEKVMTNSKKFKPGDVIHINSSDHLITYLGESIRSERKNFVIAYVDSSNKLVLDEVAMELIDGFSLVKAMKDIKHDEVNE